MMVVRVGWWWLDGEGWMVLFQVLWDSERWWVLGFVLTDLRRQQASISVAAPIHKHQSVHVFLCVFVLVCLCGCVCVYQRKKKMMRERRSLSWFCIWRRERKKRAKWEINKIIWYTATVIMYICTVTIANV